MKVHSKYQEIPWEISPSRSLGFSNRSTRYNGLWQDTFLSRTEVWKRTKAVRFQGPDFSLSLNQTHVTSVGVSQTYNNQIFGEPSWKKHRQINIFHFVSCSYRTQKASRPYAKAFFQKLLLVLIASVFKAGILKTPGKINHEIVKIKV